MMLLALSSSGPFPSVALCENGTILDYRQGESGHTHSETLMPLLDLLLQENGLSSDKIDIFAADVGPGSFTGVRIGVCAANAMAFVHRKKLIGVSALEALCYGISGRVCAMLDARNASAYMAVYENGRCVHPPEAATVESFLSRLEGCSTFVGDGAEAYSALIEQYSSAGNIISASLRADNVAMIAYQAHLNGATSDEIMPLYLRPSQAERLFEEKNGGNTVS